MNVICIIFCMQLLIHVKSEELCDKVIYTDKYYTRRGYNDAVFIWFPLQREVQRTIPLCSNNTGEPIEAPCNIGNILQHRHPRMGSAVLECSLIDDNCYSESFEHFYVKKNRLVQKHRNLWPSTKLGHLAKPRDLCLLETGLTLTRRCQYNYANFKAEWEKKDFGNVKCLQDIKQSVVTYDLNNLYIETRANATLSTKKCLDITRKLTNLLAKSDTVRIATDLAISCNIIQILISSDQTPDVLPKVLEATNLLMKCNRDVVVAATEMGTPKTLINTLETYLDKMSKQVLPSRLCHEIPNGVRQISDQYASVFYINPWCSNISGIAVYSSSAHPSPHMHYDWPTKTYYKYLHLNESLSSLMNEVHIQAAAYFPDTLWMELYRRNQAAGKTRQDIVRISIYRNINFFMDNQKYQPIPESVVLKISIPGYKGDLPDDVPTIFQKPSTIAVDNIQCGCYDYKAWTSDGIITSHRHNTILCKSRKLTSFLALIGLGNVEPILGHPIVLSTTMELTLDVISIVGCSLSLLGLLLIWLTALFCRQWRSQLSNRFLLNICFVLTLIMTYFLFINIPDWHNALVNLEFCNSCMAEGAFLQYIILVLFLWMFSTALLQYQRYVTVIGNKRPSHFIAKCALFAWGLPLIPTALVIYFDPESYMPFTTNGPICYPTGLSLYLAVLTPISTVVSINIGIFVYILYKVRISLRNNDAYHACKDTKVQLRLSLLLFFLLGISWVFGILAHIYQNIIFSLCFCLTSTLQGFILCVYFVILDRSVRYLWLKYCCGRNYKSIDNTISMSPLPSNSNHKKLYESD